MAHKIQEIFIIFDAVMLSAVAYRKVSKPMTHMSLWQELKYQRTCL